MLDPMSVLRATVEMGRGAQDQAHSVVIALSRLADALDERGASGESIAIREQWLAPGDWIEVSLMAGSRWELAEDQLALGRHADAIAAADKALRDWNGILDRDPGFVLAVGASLNLRSRGLAAAGRWDAALGAADEAAAIFRAGGGPDLAEALTHRATALTATGRLAEARAAAEEAAAIRAA